MGLRTFAAGVRAAGSPQVNKDLALAKLLAKSVRTLSGCLEYTGARDGDGYGMVSVEGRQYRANRLAWEIANSVPPPRGMVVRHRCDNPPCFDASHLILGTYGDNARDREERGRGSDRRGEKCPTARLTWTQVREIRDLFKAGRFSHNSIASRFGVSRKTVSKIVNNQTWKENA